MLKYPLFLWIEAIMSIRRKEEILLKDPFSLWIEVRMPLKLKKNDF